MIIPIRKLAAVAFLIYVLSNTTQIGILYSLYSYETRQNYNFNVSYIMNKIIGIYDDQRKSSLSGSKSGNGWIIFDYADGTYLNFNPMNSGFTVFDGLSGSYINIDINSNQIVLFCVSDGKFYTFRV